MDLYNLKIPKKNANDRTFKKCAAINCTNTEKTKDPRTGHCYRFFKFPKDPQISAKWIEQLKRQRSFTASNVGTRKVCSAHFLPSDFVQSDNPRSRLKKDAFPKLSCVQNLTSVDESCHLSSCDASVSNALINSSTDLSKNSCHLVSEQNCVLASNISMSDDGPDNPKYVLKKDAVPKVSAIKKLNFDVPQDSSDSSDLSKHASSNMSDCCPSEHGSENDSGIVSNNKRKKKERQPLTPKKMKTNKITPTKYTSKVASKKVFMKINTI